MTQSNQTDLKNKLFAESILLERNEEINDENIDRILKSLELIEEAQTIMQDSLAQAFKLDWWNDDNFTDTPKRVARALLERCIGVNSESQCEELLNKKFSSTYGGMISVGPVFVDSLCPHHFENVNYEVRIGYIVGSDCVGLSKLGRIVKLYGRQPILQETFTEEITNMIDRAINPKGVIVVVKGSHGCMTCRGLREKDVKAITSTVRGSFLTQIETREEWFKLWDL